MAALPALTNTFAALLLYYMEKTFKSLLYYYFCETTITINLHKCYGHFVPAPFDIVMWNTVLISKHQLKPEC